VFVHVFVRFPYLVIQVLLSKKKHVNKFRIVQGTT
jgi:hypothetical protein